MYLKKYLSQLWEDMIDLYFHGGIVMREELTPLHGIQTLFEGY